MQPGRAPHPRLGIEDLSTRLVLHDVKLTADASTMLAV